MAMALERDRLSHFIFVVYENIIYRKTFLKIMTNSLYLSGKITRREKSGMETMRKAESQMRREHMRCW